MESPIAAVVRTPVPDVSVNDWVAPDTAPPRVRLRLPDVPPEVFIEVFAAKVIGVPLSPIEVFPLLVNVPAKVTELGAVAVKPALKVNISPAALPSVKVPVFKNSVAAAKEFPVPVIDKL